MATLLDGVNAVLKRVSVIQGDSGALTSLTESQLQTFVDVSVQVWNEAVEEMYTITGAAPPKVLTSSTVTLVASDRDYTLASDLVRLHWPLHDQTNGEYIYEWERGYEHLLRSQSKPADYTGLPQYGVQRPTDGEVYLDKLPTASEAGRVYTYQYEKDVSLSAATDTFPFGDAVYRALIPAVAQLYRRDKEHDFDETIYRREFGRALRLVTRETQRETWGPTRQDRSAEHFDPYGPNGISA